MKKLIAIILILAMTSFALIFGCAKEEKDIKVGAVLPLTGDLAIYGQKMKNGIDLAVQQLNEEGGIDGKKVQVLYEDDQGDPKNSVAAFRKIVATEKVPVVIGGAISATALAVASIADKEQVVLFSPAATSPKLTGISKYFFRNWPSDVYEGKIMGEFAANELKLNKIAVIYVNNDWGVGLSKEFDEVFKKTGGYVAAKESFDQGANDFRTQLTKIKKSDPQAIYIIAYLKELLILLRQKQEIGIKTQLLSTYGFYDPQILDEVRKAAEGTIFTAPTFDPESPAQVVEKYVQDYQSKYRVKPDIWSAQAYDVMNIIGLALKNGAKTGPEIQTEISQLRDFEGVSGRTSFDEKGEVIKPLRFMIVKDGAFVDYNSK